MLWLKISYSHFSHNFAQEKTISGKNIWTPESTLVSETQNAPIRYPAFRLLQFA